MTESSKDAIFRFLTARQVLQLTEIKSRQSLFQTVPQPRDPAKDPALSYAFISHRWMAPQNPDADGTQLKALQQLFLYVEELLQALLVKPGKALQWPPKLEDLVEGMPQATALVSRMNLDALPFTNGEFEDPLEHIYVWYDCCCLPQKFPSGRTVGENQEFGAALQNLDQLAQQCELVCLDADDYFSRAWCAFEHYSKSLRNHEGQITLNCDKMIRRDVVDWEVQPLPPKEDPEKNRSEAQQKFAQVMAETRQTQFDVAQTSWTILHDRIDSAYVRMKEEEEFSSTTGHKNQESSAPSSPPDLVSETKKKKRGFFRRLFRFSSPSKTEVEHESAKNKKDEGATTSDDASKEAPKANEDFKEIRVPDLQRDRARIKNASSETIVQQPLFEAVTQLSRELYTAIYTLSCRDAAMMTSNQNGTEVNASRSVTIPSYHNACPEHAHGIQCGLHDHSRSKSISSQREALNQCIENCWMDLQSPDSSGTSKESGEEKTLSPFSSDHPKYQTLCERCVTLDLFQLAGSVLSYGGLKCTNSGDLAFVGLLALRNLLRIHPKDDATEQKSALKVSAGALRFIVSAVEEAVVIYSNLLANDTQVDSLRASISIKVPRWVLLDMACARLDVTTSLIVKGGFDLSQKVIEYLEGHPESISVTLDTNSKPLVVYNECPACGCENGWAPCIRKNQIKTMSIITSMTNGSVCLDPWAQITLPTPLAGHITLVARNRVYVIGGTTGDLVNSDHVYTADLPLSDTAHFALSKTGKLNHPRRNFAGCVREVDDREQLWISGSRGSLLPDGNDGDVDSTIEVLGLGEPQPCWKYAMNMPRARCRHHMIYLDQNLFIFGGQSDNAADSIALAPECDIYSFVQKQWLVGPELPMKYASGSSVVLGKRFLWVMGGAIGNQDLKSSFVLDLHPWIKWIADGSHEDSRPGSGWFAGPEMPKAMLHANVVWVTAEASGRADDTLLLVAPLTNGNFCLGMSFPPKLFEDPNVEWSASCLTVNGQSQSLTWQHLGGVPDATVSGTVNVVGSTLFMIGGGSESGILNVAYARELPQSGCIIPIGSDSRDADMVKKMRMMQFAQNMHKNLQVKINDHYLVSRLGFPVMEESDLFAEDGTKRLAVTVPEKWSPGCQRCLARPDTSAKAKSHNDAVLFTIQAMNRGRAVHLCSECLCDLYYNPILARTNAERQLEADGSVPPTVP